MTAGFFHQDIGNVKVDAQTIDDAPGPIGDMNITVDLSDAHQRDLLIAELDRLRTSIVDAARSGERFFRITFTPYPPENYDGAKLNMQFPAGPSEVLVVIDASKVKNRIAGARCVEYIRQRLIHARFPFDAVISEANV
jgi:hypothetical protein